MTRAGDDVTRFRHNDTEGGRKMPDNSAGTIRSSGFEWVWECGLCNTRGNAHFSDGAHANLVNHISGEHVTWQKPGPCTDEDPCEDCEQEWADYKRRHPGPPKRLSEGARRIAMEEMERG
jgi:hypothetical protein